VGTRPTLPPRPNVSGGAAGPATPGGGDRHRGPAHFPGGYMDPRGGRARPMVHGIRRAYAGSTWWFAHAEQGPPAGYQRPGGPGHALRGKGLRRGRAARGAPSRGYGWRGGIPGLKPQGPQARQVQGDGGAAGRGWASRTRTPQRALRTGSSSAGLGGGRAWRGSRGGIGPAQLRGPLRRISTVCRRTQETVRKAPVA